MSGRQAHYAPRVVVDYEYTVGLRHVGNYGPETEEGYSTLVVYTKGDFLGARRWGREAVGVLAASSHQRP
jgi:hypothetical protein